MLFRGVISILTNKLREILYVAPLVHSSIQLSLKSFFFGKANGRSLSEITLHRLFREQADKSIFQHGENAF